MSSLLTLKEISSTATPLSTLTKWAREGELTGAFKIGKKWVISSEDWDNFLQKKKEEYNPSNFPSYKNLINSDQLISQKVGHDEL